MRQMKSFIFKISYIFAIIKSIITTFLVFIAAFILAVLMVAFSSLNIINSERFNIIIYKILWYPFRFFCGRLSNTKIIVEGTEHMLPRGNMYLFNHRSFYDIPAIIYIKNRNFKFVAKQSLAKIPLLGRILKKMNCLLIDRSNPKKVYKLYEDMKKNFEKGFDYILAPEGTCVTTPKELGLFKKGPFIFALKGGVKIVPIVLCGTDNVLPRKKGWWESRFLNWGVWKNTVRIRVLPSIDTKNFSEDQINDLISITRDKMNTTYKELLDLEQK